MKLKTILKQSINRPINIVWEYYIISENWEKWWGGKLEEVIPGWEKGGELKWALGGSDIIEKIIPCKEITVSARWSDTTWKFKDLKGSVLIEIEEEFKGAKPRSESGWQEEWQSTLLKFKQCVEKETTTDISQNQNQNDTKRLGLFNFLKRKKNSPKIRDLVWSNQNYKLQGCLKIIYQHPDVFVVAWFDKTKKTFDKFLSKNGIKINIWMAEKVTSLMVENKYVLILEHHLSLTIEENFMGDWKAQEILILNALDDKLFESFKFKDIQRTAEKLNIKDEYIEHSLISNSIKRAQKSFTNEYIEKFIREQQASKEDNEGNSLICSNCGRKIIPISAKETVKLQLSDDSKADLSAIICTKCKTLYCLSCAVSKGKGNCIKCGCSIVQSFYADTQRLPDE
jgi:uncharacterized protein YndB with AHSA1/START domain